MPVMPKFLGRLILLCSVSAWLSLTALAVPAGNPLIWADVPDNAIVRVGDTYYMSSTTMHLSPGVPIMRSRDLVKWELVGYAYDTLADNAALRLENGGNAYGRGSWASSIRHHDGVFYVTTFSATSGRTHVYTTRDIEHGPWKAMAFEPVLHDHSLFFDDDGRVYMVYGAGDIRLAELEADVSGLKAGGRNEVIIPDASRVAGENIGLKAEGSQLLKHDGKYYLFNITWPKGGMRTVIVHRADRITGPYEGRVVLQDRGIAQGSLIDTPAGKWYAYLFEDHGAVGRIPYLVPVSWVDGWPVLGTAGKVPAALDIPESRSDAPSGVAGIIAADEFERSPGDRALPLAWQWNHNPDPRFWSVTARPGFLRLTTGRVDTEVVDARNTLTQRTFGPESSAITAVDVSQMKDGDYAGLVALQRKYGFVGVKQAHGVRSIVMVSAQSDQPVELAAVPLAQPVVYLRIDCDYKERADLAYFYYSLDGEHWTAIGEPLHMKYTLMLHFMGYRFGLFNFATRETGGHVDFDFFRPGYHLLAPAGAGTRSAQD
jgi:beta-xylosidase